MKFVGGTLPSASLKLRMGRFMIAWYAKFIYNVIQRVQRLVVPRSLSDVVPDVRIENLSSHFTGFGSGSRMSSV